MMILQKIMDAIKTSTEVAAIINTSTHLGIAGDGQSRSYPKAIIDHQDQRYHKHSTGVCRMRSGGAFIHCWSESPQQAYQLRKAIEHALLDATSFNALLDRVVPRTQKIDGVEQELFCETIELTCNYSEG